MLKNVSALTGCAIEATDGRIGAIVDILFDDFDWSIRWAVVDTGTWLSGRQVLLPPSAFEQTDFTNRTCPVDLTRDEVAASPGIDTDAPVTRQLESDIFGHYGWQPYWTPYPFTPIGAPIPPHVGPVEIPEPEQGRAAGDPGLRSAGEVTGYYIHATDGEIGHVEDFLVDIDDWAIRYVVVDTRNWWPGRKVLVAPQAFSTIDWGEGTVSAELTREQIRSGPEYDPAMTVDRDFEQSYYSYYGYAPYW